MNATAEVIHQDVLDRMPATTEQHGTALVQTDNPYLGMAQQALALGKVDQLDKLLDLQLRWDAEQARRAFVAAMAEFKAQPIKIVKAKLVEFTTRDGDTTSYRHATLASVVDAVVSAMGRNGLSHRWDVAQEGGQVRVTCTITHRGGHSESVSMQAAPDSSGKKNSIQQVASTVTYLERYTLMALAGVAAEDMIDDDGRGSAPAEEVAYITEEQEIVLRDLMDAYVNNKAKFLQWCGSQAGYKVDRLSDIPANLYQRVHDQLASIRTEKEGQA